MSHIQIKKSLNTVIGILFNIKTIQWQLLILLILHDQPKTKGEHMMRYSATVSREARDN